MTGIGRRALLQGGGAMAVPGLGRPSPSRFPYRDRPESSPGLGAGGSQIVRARRVIISGPGDGVFVYNGTPGRGSLLESVNAASMDPYGNATVPGNALYVFGGTVWQAIALAKNGSVPRFAFFIGGATQATPYVQVTGISGSGAVSGGIAQWGAVNVGGVYFNIVPPANVPPVPGSGNLVYSDGQTLHVSGAVNAVGGTPANPTQLSTDSWTAVTTPAGMTGTIRVKLLSEKNMAALDVNVTITSTSTAAVTFTAGALPSASYYPTAQRQFPVTVNQGMGTAPASPRVNIPVSGAVALDIPPFATAGNTCLVSGTIIYPLD